MRKVALLFLLLLNSVISMAVNDSVQQVSYRAIVIDAETKSRISDAKVSVDDSTETKTNWDGSFTISKPFKQIRISKRGYLKRIMNYEERTDTIMLLNNAKNLDEVVVWGKQPKMQMDFGGLCRDIAVNTPSNAPSGINFNFFDTLDHIIHAKKYKRRNKIKKEIEEY